MKLPTLMTKERLKEHTTKYHYITVGELKKFIEKHNIPDDAPVVVQRVEDFYFEENNWDVYLKDGEETHQLKIENNSTYEEIEGSMAQYIPIWCCVRYKDDSDVLFLTPHY